MVAYVFSFIDRQILSLLIEPIKHDLSLSDTQFGLLQGLAFSLFYATMGIPIASFADRYSRPLTIVLGIAFWSVATMACGLTRSFGQLFVARLGVGAGEAALSPATYSLISDLFPKEKLGRAVGVYSMGPFVGAGIAFLVGGSVIQLAALLPEVRLFGEALAPWHLVFVLVGFPGVLLALVIALTVHEPDAATRYKARREAPSTGQVLAFLWRERAIFGPHLFGFSFMAMSLFALLGWAPAYLIRTFGMTAAQSGLWLGMVALIAGVSGVLASGWFMDWQTERGRRDAPFHTGIVGSVGTIPPMALLPFTSSPGVALALLCVAMFFASTPMPPSTAVMQVVAPPAMRARVSAIFLFLNSFIGLAMGAALVGFLNDRVFASEKAVGSSMAVVVIAAAVLSIVLLLKGRRPYMAFETAAA
ncbi:MFS transporter [Novosphingobium sp. RD2P27]|uniref:MFS transporter n=1 Tax=Novosphingobium kalidii TaxID=3230299 RepID=A0ABV2D242_9SPHN